MEPSCLSYVCVAETTISEREKKWKMKEWFVTPNFRGFALSGKPREKVAATRVGRKHRKRKEEASDKLSGGTYFLQLGSAP